MMRRMMLTTVSMAFLVYVGFSAYLFANQRDYLYFPTPEAASGGGGSFLLPNGEVTLKIWEVNPGRERALIYFGGNAEGVEHNREPFARHFPGQTVYLPNYRGFGGSSGTPTEAGLFADALALYDHIAARHSEVRVMGRSLGSGVATYLAMQREVSHLVLVTPFDSIETLAKREYPLFPVGWLLVDKFDSVSRAPRVRAKILILVAGKDQMIPTESSRELARAFGPERSRVALLPEADHFNVADHPRYYPLLQDFLAGEAGSEYEGTFIAAAPPG